MMGNNCNYQMFELKKKNLLHSAQPGDQVQIVLEPCDKAKSFWKIISALNIRICGTGRLFLVKLLFQSLYTLEKTNEKKRFGTIKTILSESLWQFMEQDKLVKRDS